jgi:hypothetical protein
MAAGRFCDQCNADLWETDPNERISLVPQVVLGLWPILIDTQEQLDFCQPKCATRWFAAAEKKRPGLLAKEAKRDAKVTGDALKAADRTAEILARLTELPGQQAVLQADPGSARQARALEQERHRLLRELNEIGGARGLGGAPAASGVTGSSGPRGGSAKARTRR